MYVQIGSTNFGVWVERGVILRLYYCLTPDVPAVILADGARAVEMVREMFTPRGSKGGA